MSILSCLSESLDRASISVYKTGEIEAIGESSGELTEVLGESS